MPKPDPHLSVRAIVPLVEGLRALGSDPRGPLAAAGIAPGQLREPDAAVTQSAVMRFWGAAAQLTRHPDLGLALAEAAPITSFEIHAYALLSSPTLREALRRACHYQRLIHETTALELEETATGARLRHALPDGRSVPRHPAEFLVALWVRLGRLVAGEDWIPERVCFAHAAPASTAAHRRVLRCAPVFDSGVTTLAVAGGVLDRPNPRADPALAALMDRLAVRLLAHKPRSAALAERVRARLAQEIGTAPPSAAAIASAFGMSPRTLHRQLRAEGTRFRDLAEQVRHERAVHLLTERACSIAEIAFVLGFSELSAFYRAFRRWTGQSPAAFRCDYGRRRHT